MLQASGAAPVGHPGSVPGEAGMLDLRLEPMDLRTLPVQTVNLFALVASNAGVGLSMTIS